MDERLMNAMLELDDRHWWYRGRRRIIRAELDRLPLPAGARVLDAGCGSGRTLEELSPYGEVFGVELDPGAADVARARGRGEVVVGRLEELPWEDGSFDLITCLDVIEHTPDDRVTLQRAAARVPARRLPARHGPAYQGLWSTHDVANHHYRRYSRPRLRAAARRRRLAGDADDVVQRAAAGAGRGGAAGRAPPRLREPNGGLQAGADARPRTGSTRCSSSRLRLEARWLASGRTMPAGLSLLAVLENPGGVA